MVSYGLLRNWSEDLKPVSNRLILLWLLLVSSRYCILVPVYDLTMAHTPEKLVRRNLRNINLLLSICTENQLTLSKSISSRTEFTQNTNTGISSTISSSSSVISQTLWTKDQGEEPSLVLTMLRSSPLHLRRRLSKEKMVKKKTTTNMIKKKESWKILRPC